MHVAFLNPQGNFDPTDAHLTEHPDFGGQLIYVKELAVAMADTGHHVDILTRRMQDPAWPEFAGAEDSYPGHEGNPRILRFDCGGPAFLAKEELWPHMEEFVANILAFYGEDQPDFTTAHYADGGYCAALIARKAGIGFSFTGHSLGAQKVDNLGAQPGNFEALDERFRFSRRIAAERLAMARAFRIIVSTGQERREQYGHGLYAGAVETDDDARFAVIPPGVNTRVFRTEPAPGDARDHARIAAKLGDRADRPFVVLSSRLDAKKNIIGAVEAFGRSAALREAADLALFVRGIDDPRAEIGGLPDAEQRVLRPILEKIDGNGLSQQVYFLNLRSQAALASAYRYFARTGSVFALPSLYEPFGLAPVEAAASGLACVATKNGGPAEIFADGSGVLVDPRDAGDIAKGLLEGLRRHAELTRRAGARVKAHYTWEKTAEGYLAVIAEGIDALAPREDLPPLDASDRIRRYLTDKTA